jgi:hypothetical protein
MVTVQVRRQRSLFTGNSRQRKEALSRRRID